MATPEIPIGPSLNPSFTGPVVLGTQTQWFNPNAFILPAVGTYGQCGTRHVYTGPGLADVDLSVFKNTALSERFKLQFRAEFFNLLNRTNLGRRMPRYSPARPSARRQG